MFFNVLATFAEFEVDLLRLRTREGMAIAKAKGKLRGKQPQLTGRQQTHLVQLHAAGEHTTAELGGAVRGVTADRVPSPRTQPHQHNQHLKAAQLGDLHGWRLGRGVPTVSGPRSSDEGTDDDDRDG
jgi:DNA invertase Pin-like site-specific DNA recombinase